MSNESHFNRRSALQLGVGAAAASLFGAKAFADAISDAKIIPSAEMSKGVATRAFVDTREQKRAVYLPVSGTGASMTPDWAVNWRAAAKVSSKE